MCRYNQNNKTKIIDKTVLELYLNEYSVGLQQIVNFIDMLKKLGVDKFEISSSVLEKLQEQIIPDDYLIRVESGDNLRKCIDHGTNNFVVNYNQLKTLNPTILFKMANVKTTVEFYVNKLEDVFLIDNKLNELINSNNMKIGCVRLIGLCEFLDPSWCDRVYDMVRKYNIGIDICPKNDFYTATAVAVEAIMHGLDFVTASFAGYGKQSYAPLEEVLMSAQIFSGSDFNQNLKILPSVAEYFSDITDVAIPESKPVIGSGIFRCESGIHVSAISKNPLTYEPFDPGIVGQTRKICIGKHTGTQSVLRKARELGFDIISTDMHTILNEIRNKSMEIRGELDDKSLRDIFMEHM